jgi:cytochrome c-type biogenesis protein CcmF
VEAKPGDTFSLGHYQLRVADMTSGDNENYSWSRAQLEVSRNGQPLGTLEPERRFYKASNQSTSEVAIRRRPNEDLYLNYAGPSQDNQRAVIQAFVFPLVDWIWIGFGVLLSGTLICLVPSKIRLQYPRTQVLGVTKKVYATVKN